MEETTRLSGLDELKAVAHPLRVRLLGALREHGPATATELARRFETDTGSTSYHLRKLAEFGFVTEIADPEGHHRARRWAAAHRLTSWSSAELAATAEGREVLGFFHRAQVDALTTGLDRYSAGLADLPPEWVDAFGMSDLIARLTARSLTSLHETIAAEVDRLSTQDAQDPDARPVSLIVAGLPR